VFHNQPVPPGHALNRSAHLSLLASIALLAAIAAAAVLLPGAAPADVRGPDATVAGEPVTTTAGGEVAVAGEVLVAFEGESAPREVPIAPNADPATVAENIEDSRGVRYAIPNYVASTSGWLPNDPGVLPRRKGPRGGWRDKQWNFLPCLSLCSSGLSSTKPQSRGGMNVIRAWQHLRRAGRPGAAGVKVAVLDTGIAYRRLGRSFRRSPDFGPRRFLRGYDFVSDDPIPLDLNGHGTHVASTIGEQTNNGRSLTGIAYRSKLMPVRVMDANGDGSTADIAAGIRWAARHGARVISMSLNFACGVSVPPVEEALREAWRRGAVLVGSSGNRGSETCPSLPATSPKVISVGGTTESGCVASYTFRSEKIDIAAPGGGQDLPDCPWSSRNRSIFQLSLVAGDPTWFGIERGWVGTSMAAAHVAGAAAAVIASGVLGAKAGPGRVADRLKETARLPAWSGSDPASGFGAGIVDLGRATNPAVSTG